MADIWHSNTEVPSIGSTVIAKYTRYTEYTITNKTDEDMFMANTSILRWRYSYESNVWHTMDERPGFVQTVVAENREYKCWVISNGAVQTMFINDTNILKWCGWQDVLDTKATNSKKTMSGIKEGEQNDWAPTVDGFIELEYDEKMLRQQINSRLQTLPNEVDGFDGIDYLNVIFGNTTWAVKAQALIDVIKEIPAVKDVLYVSSAWTDKIGGEFKITFAIESVFGKINFTFGIDEQNKTINLN